MTFFGVINDDGSNAKTDRPPLTSAVVSPPQFYQCDVSSIKKPLSGPRLPGFFPPY